MVNINVTGRLIADAKFHGEGDKPFMTFQLAGKKRNTDSIIFNCIRSVSAQPKNFDSFKKGAILSVTGEPDINEYTPEGGEKRYNWNLDVQSVQVESLAQ